MVKKGATISHSVYLSGGMDDDNNCKARIIQFSNGKTMGEQMARALHKITLREDLTKINEWMGTITFLSGIQTRASDKSIVDSLEGIIIWEYDSLACPQKMV